ncbi:hypothetical protein Q3H58_004001 [Pseudomonas psychrotolerans]|nr:hypothetical protein [Pseudomonas psychrotolerans]
MRSAVFFADLDAGDACHGEDIALGMAAALDQREGFRTQAHPGFGSGFTEGHLLVGDIDHVGTALGIEMGQHGMTPGKDLPL